MPKVHVERDEQTNEKKSRGKKAKPSVQERDVTPSSEVSGTKPRLSGAWSDAVNGLARTKSLTVWSIVTIALSLFLVGSFVVSDLIISNALTGVEDEVTIYAFVDDSTQNDDGTPNDALNAYMDKLRGTDGVKDVSFTTKDQAWQDYRKSMGEESADKALAALDGQNPLPASIVVTMNDANNTEAMAEQIEQDEDFAALADGGTVDGNVTYGKQQVAQLLNFTNTIRNALAVFVIIFVGVACVLISNTIRNSIASRSEEIGIMRLVGASKSYIRKPFTYEGIIQSGIGAGIAVILLLVMQHVWLPSLQEAISFIHIDIPGWQYAVIYLGVIILGIAIGVISANVSMRRHLTA